MMDLGGPLLLVGCGKMGGALLAGWLERGLAAESVWVVEPFGEAAAQWTGRGVRVVAGAAELPSDLRPAIVVLAIKPQQMDATLPDYGRFVAGGAVFLSIAAGKTIATLQAGLGAEAAVVRAMPNTPAAVGRGVTVLVASDRVGSKRRQDCGALLSAVGAVAWVEEEALLDPVTALSGGGPAYVFLLVEVMAEAGVAAGLPAALAMELARSTVAGAGELLHRAEEPASRLRENVTSPGGTTLEALKVLMAPDGLQPLMTRAIAAASARSRELAS